MSKAIKRIRGCYQKKIKPDTTPLISTILDMPRKTCCKIDCNLAFIKLCRKLHGTKNLIKMFYNDMYGFNLDNESKEYMELILKQNQ